MPRKTKLSIIDWGHAQQPDFSIPVPDAKHHDAAAQHYEEAARHRRQAAKLSDSASRDKASHHAHPVYAHHLHAERQAEESAQAEIKNHLEDSR